MLREQNTEQGPIPIISPLVPIETKKNFNSQTVLMKFGVWFQFYLQMF